MALTYDQMQAQKIIDLLTDIKELIMAGIKDAKVPPLGTLNGESGPIDADNPYEAAGATVYRPEAAQSYAKNKTVKNSKKARE